MAGLAAVRGRPGRLQRPRVDIAGLRGMPLSVDPAQNVHLGIVRCYGLSREYHDAGRGSTSSQPKYLLEFIR